MKNIFIYVLLLLLYACNNNDSMPSEKAVTMDTAKSVDNKAVLSLWSDSTRTRIETWVKEVTTNGSPNFIPATDRIAVFDNDGTLWPEQPVPFQLLFVIDNIRALAPTHPKFYKDPVLKGVIDGDFAPLQKAGIPGLLKLVNAGQNQQTEETFSSAVRNWMDTAKDKKFGRLYKQLVFEPMIELLHYLRAHDFKTFIVSGGGADFMRVWSEEAYGIPPYQVVGSYGDAKYELIAGKPVITKTSAAPFVDDKSGKPVGIHRFIGKVPVFCAGNSDGDQAMMQYTSGSKYKSLCIILHHTDANREFAYDLKTLSGHLETALAEAKEKNWLVVDMKNDFKKIFAFQ